ncbi:MAG: hypothetical protein JWP87_6096 [Labilithrix sp.]|nr:hypothetical protein [Labilithrix sp.]
MNRRWVLITAVPAVALGLLAACGDDDDGGAVTPDSGMNSPEGSTTDGPGGGDSALDQKAPETGTDASITATTLAKFDPVQGELPEGLAVQHIGADTNVLVGFAPQGRIVKVLGDGGVSEFASFTNPKDTFTLGMTLDPANNVYVAIANTGAAPSPAPGVYKIPAAGGTPVLYTTVAAGITFGFLNGLEFIGTDLYITDSQGSIYVVNNLGITTTWITADALAGDVNDCKLGNGFPIGINGIAHDANNVYVVNTDKGSLLKIARNADAGTAGVITVLKKDPSLCGADGLVMDKDGTLLVANNAKNKIQRVTTAGVITDVFSGKPLDSPASLWIDTQGTARRLLVTNAAFASSAADGGMPAPSLVSMPLP